MTTTAAKILVREQGSRPRAIHYQRTQSTYLFGAVCPERGAGAALVLPACNTEDMQLHLDAKTSRLPKTSRSCRCRRVRRSSTRKKISGNSCGRTGCRTASSNPSTKSSITAATPGIRSSINRGKSCPSLAAIGQSPVTHCEGWYEPSQKAAATPKKAQRLAHRQNQRRDKNW